MQANGKLRRLIPFIPRVLGNVPVDEELGLDLIEVGSLDPDRDGG